MADSDVRIEIDFVGPACTHNLICWVCGERKAVYHMYPVWCFGPCWECNGDIGGSLTRLRSGLFRRRRRGN